MFISHSSENFVKKEESYFRFFSKKKSLFVSDDVVGDLPVRVDHEGAFLMSSILNKKI